MASATLPSPLQDQLDDLAGHLRFWRFMRGIGLFLLVLTGTAALAIGLDALVDLPRIARCGLFGAWVALGVGYGWAKLIRPSIEPIDDAALALTVEKEYPKLAERLSTTVEVAHADHPGHGSPELIALLARETEQRAKKLDFLRAVPTQPATRTLTVGLLAILLAGVAVGTIPGGAERARRFFLPWYSPTADVPYRLVVTSGDPAIKKGESITLAAYLETLTADAKLPTQVFLIARPLAGKEERIAMTGEADQIFSVRRGPIAEDFEYRIEAGAAESELHRVTAVTPVDLAPETAIAVEPPAYAAKFVEAIPPAPGFADVASLQFGQVVFDLRLTRKPVNAFLEWSAQGEKVAVRIPLTTTDDLAIAHTLPAERSGQLSLVLEAEHGIRTELPPLTLTVRPDAPPRFVEVMGVSDQPRLIRPSEPVTITVNAVDDVSLAKMELEYRINDGPVQTVAIPAKGIDSTQVTANYAFQVPNWKEGDLVSYRLRATDNRDLPTHKLTPQSTYFPADDKWAELKATQSAEPLQQQEIVGQHQQIQQKLDDLVRDLKSQSRAVDKVKSLPPLDIEAARRLGELREQARQSMQQAEQLARDAGMTPPLRELADRIQEVADQQLRQANDALRNAEAEREQGKRNPQLTKAGEQIDQAIDKLEKLARQNDEIAKQRLDQQRLEDLAREQQQLAEQAAKSKPEELAEIQRRQKEIEQELDKLVQKSEALQEALKAQQAEMAREAANKARDLAQDQRDLAQAMKQNDQQAKQDRVADVAKQQKDLAQQIQQLAQKSDPAVRAAQARPLDPQSSRAAEQSLEKGELFDALKHQERAMFDLERLAADLERAAAKAADPREAARQLGRMQDDLRQRLAQATRDKKLTDLPKEQRDQFRGEQEAIRRATEALSVPPNDAQAQAAQKNAADFAQKADENLDKNNQAIAEASMLRARDALNRLAEMLPTQEKRTQQARAELARLREQQDQINRGAEQAAKDFATKDPADPKVQRDLADRLAELGKRQAGVAEKLAQLDTPNQEPRRDRVLDAMKDALNDILEGKGQDIPASQQEAKRQLDRLDQALSGQRPVDEQAAELARKQGELAKEAAKAAQLPANERAPKMNDLQRQQADIAKQASALPAAEAPNRQADAADATQQAAKEVTPEALAQKAAQARDALERLAEQLQGKESNAERADRLAKKVKDKAQQAEARGDQKPEPNQQMVERQQLQRLQDEAKQLRGEDAPKEKQRAAQALEKAERLAQQNAPQPQQAQARREAADALQRLADKLQGEQSPAQEAQNLARDQRELAQQANNPMADPKQAAARQQELAERADQLAKKMQGQNENAAQAAEQMKQAQQALQKANKASDAKQPLDQAAQSAEQLAKDLAQPANPPMPMKEQPSAEQLTRELAKKQRDLAQATQQAQQQADPKARQQAMQRVAEQQKDLNKQASDLPAERTPQALQQARDAMNRAEQSLERQDGAQAQRQQNDAAQALEQMAQQQAQRRQPGDGQPQPANQPAREQARAARDLAKQQSDLRNETLRAMGEMQKNQNAKQPMPMANPEGNPVPDIAKQQQDIAKQANELAKSVQQDKGQQSPSGQQSQQAAQSAERAAQQMENGALPQAKESGQMAAQRLEQLAQSSEGATAQKARQLAQQQEELNKKLDPLTRDAQAARQQQQLRQQDLQQQAEQLTQELGKMNQSKGMRNPHAEEARQQAEQARELMRQAQQQMQQGQPNNAQQTREQAAQALERASQQAQQAAQQMAKGQPQPGNPMNPSQAGESVRQAQQQMQQAQQQLGKGQQQPGAQSMQQAAQQLNQASQQLSQANRSQQPSNGGQNANPGQGMPDLSQFGPDAKKYAGKSWGELPGELKTKIVQDMKARYGDDYAKVIKYYFEQLADRK